MNNLTVQIPNFVSVSDLQRDYVSVLKQLKKLQEPLMVLKRNSLEAVMLSPQSYKEIVDKIREYEEKEVLKIIEGYEEEKKVGKLKKMKNVDELFK